MNSTKNSLDENKNVYLFLDGLKLIQFENDKWTSRKSYKLDRMACLGIFNSKPLLVECRDVLTDLWQPIKLNDIVTDAKCLVELSMLLCNGCFNGEWKMELKKKCGIFHLQTVPYKSTKKGLFDLDMEYRLQGDNLEYNREKDDLLPKSANDEAEKVHNEPKCSCTCRHRKKNIDSDPFEDYLEVEKIFRFCSWKLENDSTIFFTSPVSLYQKKSSEGENIITEPFKVFLKNPSLEAKDCFSVAIECELAKINYITFPSRSFEGLLDISIALDEFQKLVGHNVSDGMAEISKRLMELINQFEKMKNENVVMEIKKKTSCNNLKFTYRIDEC